MSTKRSNSKIEERNGLRYIQEVIERNNCIYQEIAFSNDQGNDCYIEFIENNVATSFCVFAQIKSGKSYKDNNGYKIPADKEHLVYWKDHLLPVVGLVYDDEIRTAFWVNITEYLKSNPHVVQQQDHTIRVGRQNEFTVEKFYIFKEYFINYIKEYKSYENFGRSLELFAKFDNPALCYEGLKSLFSNHRDKKAAWFHIISNFRNITEQGIQGNILGMLSNYADNPHVFWHKNNMEYYPKKDMQDYLSWALTKCFKQEEVKIALSFMNRMVARGHFSFLVFLVLSFIDDIDTILYKIAHDDSLELEDRNFAFWLYIHVAQRKSTNETIQQIDAYLKNHPDCDDDYLFLGIKDSIKHEGFIPIG